MSAISKFLKAAFVVVPISYLGACNYIAWDRNSGFDTIKIGDSESKVISHLGNPSRRSLAGELFTRYASSACTLPCTSRLWYENRMGLDIEAWSFDIDAAEHIIRKTHWVSP